MRLRPHLAAGLALISALSACGKADEAPEKAPVVAPEKGMPLDKSMSAQVGETMRMHKVAGRWQSEIGVIKGGKGQWVTLDVANDRSFSLQVRERAPDGKAEAVDVNIAGKFDWDPNGIIVAKGDGAKPPLQSFAAWRGSFPEDKRLKVVAGDQSYTLAYKGL